MARALKNMQRQVQLTDAQNEIVSSITFDDYMQKRRLKSLFLIPEQSKEQLVLNLLGSELFL